MAIRKLLPVRAHSCGDLQQRIARAFACVAVVAPLSALPSRGLGGFVASIAGIGLLGRSRGLKKECEKLLQPTIGIGYVGVRGRF